MKLASDRVAELQRLARFTGNLPMPGAPMLTITEGDGTVYYLRKDGTYDSDRKGLLRELREREQ